MPPTPHAAKSSRTRRALNFALMTLYLLAIYFACDFAYTKFLYERDRTGRIAHDGYHHGLAANFEGYETWGRTREKLFTNNLGFKDGKVRDVPAVAATRKILLMGDSFTEGVGLKFEDTFAGMLSLAGQQRAEKIEFLNAADDLVFTDPLLQEDQVPARRRVEVRRGRGVLGSVRRAGRGDRLFLFRRSPGLQTLLHRTSGSANRRANAHAGPRQPPASRRQSRNSKTISP